jgi:hypothetical protein
VINDLAKETLDDMKSNGTIDEQTYNDANQARTVIVMVTSVGIAGAGDPVSTLGEAAQAAKIGLSVAEGTTDWLSYEEVDGKQKSVVEAVHQGSKLTKAIVSVCTMGTKAGPMSIRNGGLSQSVHPLALAPEIVAAQARDGRVILVMRNLTRGRCYTIEATESLGRSNWECVGTLTADSEAMSWEDPVLRGTCPVFYRVSSGTPGRVPDVQ